MPQASPSLFKKGLWLAQVPENFPFFFSNIFMPIPAKTKASIKMVIRKTVENDMCNNLMQYYYKCKDYLSL